MGGIFSLNPLYLNKSGEGEGGNKKRWVSNHGLKVISHFMF